MKVPPPCATSTFDFTDVDEQSEHLTAARQACAGCPLLVSCRRNALEDANTAGLTGGMTENERLAWRERHHVTVSNTDVLDVTPAWEITPRIAEVLPVMESGDFHSSLVDTVLRMTQAGMWSALIVERLGHPQVKAPESVDYIRRTYAKKHTKVEWSPS